MNVIISVEQFAALLPGLWSARTSACPGNWRKDNPAANQCAPTSLLAWKLFGGEIFRVEFQMPDGVSGQHFFNHLPETGTRDFTSSQFMAGTSFSVPVNSSREVLRAVAREFIISRGLGDELIDGDYDSRVLPKHMMFNPATRRGYDVLVNKLARACGQTTGSKAAPSDSYRETVEKRNSASIVTQGTAKQPIQRS